MHLPSLLLCFVAAVTGVSARTQPQQPTLIVGTHTRDEGWIKGMGKGIYTYKLNPTDGSLTPWSVTPLGVNPVYVQGTKKQFSNGKRVIYAVNAVDDAVSERPGEFTGYVSALTLNDDGTLKLLNTLETHGASPTHISLDHDENFVVISNYGGSVTMFPVNADGSLAHESFHADFKQGSNVVANRQATGHIHSTIWLPNSMNLVAANLGSDELLQYKLNPKQQTLASLETVKSSPGSGPRHMAIHSDLNMAYVVGEYSNTVSVYTIDKKSAVLSTKFVQEITTLPTSFTNSNSVADIHLSSNQKFLYTSNRGHDSIAIFEIETDGTLKPLGWESARGSFPHSFVIYGNWLIVANLKSSDMYVFEVDSKTGLLSFTGNSYEIGTPEHLYIT